MNTPLHIQELNRARDWYNPLRGLDTARVIRMLEDAERGRYDELQKLNRMAEKRHPTLKALKERRLSALEKLDWDVKIRGELPAGVTQAQAEAQRDFLRDRYEAVENLTDAIQFVGLASFRGFAHLEKRYQEDDAAGPVIRLNPVPQWHWLRNPSDFTWRYDAAARHDVAGSKPIDKADFIIREVDDPLCEIALLCMIRRVLGKRDWAAFMADYAIPSVFASLGENTPTDQVKEWLAVMERVTGNSRGALPPGSKVSALELGKLDGLQFSNYIGAEDADLVLAGTGGLLTMLTAATGMNSDQAGTHESTFDAIALAEARKINALFQGQFDKPLLAQDFPGQPVLAYFELAAEDQEDLTALAERVSKYYSAGLEADAAEIGEKSGLKLTRKAAPVVAIPGAPAGEGAKAPAAPELPLTNRASDTIAAGNGARFLSNAEQQLAAADLAVLAPVIARVGPIRAELARLVDLDDGAFTAGLEALQPLLRSLQADLLGLERQVLTARPDLDDAFTDIIGTAFASGVIAAGQSRQADTKTEAAKP